MATELPTALPMSDWASNPWDAMSMVLLTTLSAC